MRIFLLAILYIALLAPGRAQQDLGSHFLRGTWQAGATNPALLPEGRFSAKLPEVYDNIFISSVTYNDLIGADKEGAPVLDVDGAIALLDDRNLIREDLEIGTLGFGMRLGRWYLSLSHAIRHHAWLNYPKTLPQLIWQGNAQFIGETVDAATDVQLNGYHELGFGAAVEVTRGLTLGGRIKWLDGFADVSTARTGLLLTTDETAYALTLDADFLANNSGTISYDGFRELEVDFQFGRFETDRLFRNNYGYAVDLGAHLKLAQWDFAASVLNLGQIKWQTDVQNYRLEGIREFEGLDIATGILEDSTDFGSVLDTLASALDVVETREAYTVALPARAYLSAGFQLDQTWRFGALFYTGSVREEAFYAAAVAAHARLWPFFELGATYAWRNGTFDNLGINGIVKAGPVRIVASTDNILSALRLMDSHSANIRLGISLHFGSAVKGEPAGDQENFF